MRNESSSLHRACSVGLMWIRGVATRRQAIESVMAQLGRDVRDQLIWRTVADGRGAKVLSAQSAAGKQ